MKRKILNSHFPNRNRFHNKFPRFISTPKSNPRWMWVVQLQAIHPHIDSITVPGEEGAHRVSARFIRLHRLWLLIPITPSHGRSVPRNGNLLPINYLLPEFPALRLIRHGDHCNTPSFLPPAAVVSRGFVQAPTQPQICTKERDSWEHK